MAALPPSTRWNGASPGPASTWSRLKPPASWHRTSRTPFTWASSSTRVKASMRRSRQSLSVMSIHPLTPSGNTFFVPFQESRRHECHCPPRPCHLLTHEGQLVPEQREWQTANNTYGFSTGLGIVEWAIALLVLSYPVSKRLGLLGAFLSFATTLVTLSFLFTTPEAWVPALGDAQHGFPYLSGAGRLVLKDTMMLAGSWIIGIDAAKAILAGDQKR